MARLRLRAKRRTGGPVSVFRFLVMTRPGSIRQTAAELEAALRASLPAWERNYAGLPGRHLTAVAPMVAGWCRGCGVEVPGWLSSGETAAEVQQQAREQAWREREAKCRA